MSASVETDNGWASVEFVSCVVHTKGEFGGNLDIALRSSVGIPEKGDPSLVKYVRLRVPGVRELLGVIATGSTPKLITLCFHAPSLEGSPVPKSVEVLWCKDGEQSLGMLSCSEAGPERVVSGPIKTIAETETGAAAELELISCTAQGQQDCAELHVRARMPPELPAEVVAKRLALCFEGVVWQAHRHDVAADAMTLVYRCEWFRAGEVPRIVELVWLTVRGEQRRMGVLPVAALPGSRPVDGPTRSRVIERVKKPWWKFWA